MSHSSTHLTFARPLIRRMVIATGVAALSGAHWWSENAGKLNTLPKESSNAAFPMGSRFVRWCFLGAIFSTAAWLSGCVLRWVWRLNHTRGILPSKYRSDVVTLDLERLLRKHSHG